MTTRIGIDIGGTFTDLVVMKDDGTISIEKVFTTPDNLANGVIDCISRMGVNLSEVGFVFHASTQGSNAVIEGNGARTALLATKGFRDVIEIRRGQKTAVNPRDTYNLDKDVPQSYHGGFDPLVPRHLRYELNERVMSNGELHVAVSDAEISRVANRLKKKGVESVAVSYLFSFLNPRSEIKTKEKISTILPDVYLSLSSEVLPVIREYERTSTTVLNAFIGPLILHYVRGLLSSLTSLGLEPDRFFIMQSNGGVTTPSVIFKKPVYMIESGPSAGVSGGCWLAREIGVTEAILFDMGGTTAKAAIVEEGEPIMSDQMWIEDKYFLAIPHIELVEIGAGGGSIASVDAYGALKVGPRSAGAMPGPACYSRGGKEPTVTDADLVLGYLDPNYFLGGELTLDVANAKSAIKAGVADRIHTSVEEAATSILNLVNVKMSNAIRLASVKRGHDPTMFTMMAFGGAGPVHCAALAQNLGVSRITIPQIPGNFSALGLLATDSKHEEVKSYPSNLASLDDGVIADVFAGLHRKVMDALSAVDKGGDITYLRYADMRYEGQAHEITVKVSEGSGKQWKSRISEEFSKLHESMFGYSMEEKLVEVITFRVIGVRSNPKPRLNPPPRDREVLKLAEMNPRPVWFKDDFVQTTVFNREYLPEGVELKGPAVIEEKVATTVVPPQSKFTVDRTGNILMELQTTS